jgi:hypothetical protein
MARKRRSAKERFWAGLVFLLVCNRFGGSDCGYQIYNAKYQTETALAQVGTKHHNGCIACRHGQKSLDASSITHAQHEVAAASAVSLNLTLMYSFSGALYSGLGSFERGITSFQ